MKQKRKAAPSHFTNQELALNRQGKLTGSQKSNLRSIQIRNSYPSICGSLVSIGLAFAIATGSFGPNEDRGGGLVLIGILGLFTFAAVAFAWKKWQQFQSDLDQGRVDSVRGEISLSIQESTRGLPAYWLNLEEFRWKLSKEEFLEFSNHEYYCLYFAPHSGTILSFERLASHSDNLDDADLSVSAKSNSQRMPEKPKRKNFSLSDDAELIEVDKKADERTLGNGG